MRTLTTPLRAVSLQFGSGLSRNPHVCFLRAPREFTSPVLALRSLAHEFLPDFLEHYMQSADDVEEVCCNRNRSKNPKANFCQACGKPIRHREFCGEAFQSYVTGALEESIIGYGDNWCSFDSADDVLSMPRDAVLVIDSDAALYLFLLLQDDRVPGLSEDQKTFWDQQETFGGYENFIDWLWNVAE